MKKLLIILFLLPLMGCFSTPNSKFFVLEDFDISDISSKRLSIAVYDINVPDFIDKPQIVLQKPQSPELKISEFNRWATDLNVMIKNTLINNLSSALPSAKITSLNFGSNYQYVVKVNIEKLNGWFNDLAYLKVNWQILNSRGKVLYSKDSEYSTAVKNTYESYVKAQSTLLADLSKDIAIQLSKM